MTSATVTSPRVAHAPRTRRNGSFAVDPYRVEDCTWTREQILRDRGYPVARRRTRRQAAACRDAG